MSSHLVIGDPHAHPDHSNERFTALGNFVVDRKPDVIVNIGDWGDFPSLCSYDKGIKSEGRRYTDDVRAANDALERFEQPVRAYNSTLRRGKRRLYLPRRLSLIGNHEHRVTKAAELTPELFGTLSVDDVSFRQYGWEVAPFLEPKIIEGVAYCHYFVNRGGQAIAGDNVANLVLQRTLCSSVFGHSHIRDFSEKSTLDGRRIIGLNVGCFFDYDMSYAGMVNDKWYRGIVMLHDVHEGQFDVEFINIDRLKKEYL